jgi:NADH:ubiquinone oxidoreductase subunit E
MLKGGMEVYEHVKQRLGVGHMQATSDGKFSLEEVECMGACGGAPMIAINEDFYENVTLQSTDALLDKCV